MSSSTKPALTNVICVIQEAGNVALEERCRAAASTFDGDMENLQADNTDLQGSQATIESKLQADDSIDGILTLGGDMAGAAVGAVESVGTDIQIGTFDLNAEVAQDVLDGKLLFAIDQQPYVQGYEGVVGHLPEAAQRQRPRWRPAGLLRPGDHHR